MTDRLQERIAGAIGEAIGADPADLNEASIERLADAAARLHILINQPDNAPATPPTQHSLPDGTTETWPMMRADDYEQLINATQREAAA